MGRTLAEGAVDDEMAVGHAGDARHFMRDENDGCVLCYALESVIEMVFESFVEIAKRLVKYKHAGL